LYGFDRQITGSFGTQRARHGATARFALWIYGTKGVIRVGTGTLPAASFLDDPAWAGGSDRAAWQPITSAGLNKAETLQDSSAVAGNIRIVKDLIAAIENARQPRCSMYDGRAALEMILAVYESQRTN